jgi:hypothetical protein
MNKIEAVIEQTKSLIDYKRRQKAILTAEIIEFENMLDVVISIQNNHNIPNEETKVSETSLNSNKQ